MNNFEKVLLTIPSFIGFIYMLTFWSIELFLWITNNLVPFEYQNLIFSLILYPSLAYLIYRIWTFKNINKNIKWNWTFLILFFSIITAPYYIWNKDDTFKIQNNKNQ